VAGTPLEIKYRSKLPFGAREAEVYVSAKFQAWDAFTDSHSASFETNVNSVPEGGRVGDLER
jgi:hypothetical protein